MQNTKTLKLVTSAVLIALGTILSMIKPYDLPYGGSITLFGMVPMVVLGYKYGIKWGLLCGVVYSLLQMLLGATMSQAFAGMTGWTIPLMAFLDYIVAFTVLGLSGMFRNKIKNPIVSIAIGSAIAVILRLITHFISGWILWGDYAEWFFTDVMNGKFGTSILENFSGNALAAIYSFVYNASYMIPELIVTLVGVIVLAAIPHTRKLIKPVQ